MLTDHLWFKARSFGWDWTPASIEGWIVLAAFFALLAVGAGALAYEVHVGGATVRWANQLFVGWLGLLIGLLIAICWLTGERPRWRWGD